jgi:hypothetical protein
MEVGIEAIFNDQTDKIFSLGIRLELKCHIKPSW